MVLVSHYGFAQDVEIARQIDGIDVILGGHTHDLLAAPVRVGGTIITQSGAHGSYLTRLDVEVAHGRVVDMRHALLTVRADGPADPSVSDVVDDALRPHRDRLDEVVGEARTLLHRGTSLESPMDDLVASAYLGATGADVALTHGWRYGTPTPPGPITAEDVWQMIPSDPELFTVRLTGAELRRLLETSLERALGGNPMRQQGGYAVRFAGMHAVVRLNNPAGTRVQQLEIGGAPANAEREYVVAAAGEQSVEKREGRTMTGVRAVDAVSRHLRRGPWRGRDAAPSLVAI